MVNELHSKSLKELRVLYPGIKSNSKVGFIEKLVLKEMQDNLNKEELESYEASPAKFQGILNVTEEFVITDREAKENIVADTKDMVVEVVSEGLGDTIEKVLESTVLKPITKAIKKIIFKDGEDCGCKERKVKLNQKFKYKLKPRCFTEQEYKEWGEFKKKVTLTISDKQVRYICKTFSEVMSKQYYEPCRGCSPKPLIYMIDSLNVVYDSYKV